MMNAGLPLSLRLPPLLLLAALSGCSQDSASTIPADDFLVDVESPLHDIRAGSIETWANSDEPCAAVLMTQDQAGWSYAWRVGGGAIQDAANAAAITWRTPLDTLSWVELTIHRGDESYLCRRWMTLRLEPLSVSLQAEDVAPGAVSLDCGIVTSPRSPLTLHWGADEGQVHDEQVGFSATWDARTAGSHRVWLAVDDGLRQAADTLEVTMSNVAPEFGPGSAELGADWPCGALLDVYFKGADANRDSLTLDVLSLDGLVLEGMSQHAAHPSMFVEYQTYWVLALRDVGEGAGWRSVFLRLSDGSATHEQVFHFWALCP